MKHKTEHSIPDQHISHQRTSLMLIMFCFCLNLLAQSHEEKELLISAGNVQIGGTLLIPAHKKTDALVIMSSGSGQQDRDETLDGFKIFKAIATHLAEKGIASFRYDDRGVGQSTGNFGQSTRDDLAGDIEKIMDYFETSSQTPYDRFILFGHSLGGIIAGDVAAQSDRVTQVILMASPSVPLIDLILFQERQAYMTYNIDRDLIEAEISSHNQLMNALTNGGATQKIIQTFETNIKNILEVHPEHLHLERGQKDKMAKDKAAEFHIVYAMPAIASYLYHNPSEVISKLKMPVLALFGGKDKQVTIDQNKDHMEGALLRSGAPYKIKIFNCANHYFQKAKTGDREEYPSLKKAFVDGFLDTISGTILDSQKK